LYRAAQIAATSRPSRRRAAQPCGLLPPRQPPQTLRAELPLMLYAATSSDPIAVVDALRRDP
jgi:hypothetical protein